jgi:type I restriction enzyme, S subunit
MDMLLEQFKVLFDRPEKVKKLRELILQLAVRGKLVEQDEKDEPAFVLLERIREEKERLVREGKIKKEKPLPEIGEDEKLYEQPKGWEWIRLGEHCIVNPRNSLNDEIEVSFIPMKMIEDGFKNKHTSETKLWKEIKSGFTHFAENDIVVAKITPCFENRKSVILKNLKNGYGAGTTELHVVRTISELILPQYILNIFKTKAFINGGVETYTGTAGQQRVKKDYIEQLPIILPPLDEQKRIVQKVDSFMTVCDKLEKQLERKVKYSSLSSKSAFNRIGHCNTAEELEEALRFIIENFKDLTLGDGAVKELKNAILQLAVQGKLVQQDPSDEPASVLLEKIKEEKERLISEGEISKGKYVPPIDDDQAPYEFPNSWVWIRLGTILYSTEAGKSPNCLDEPADKDSWGVIKTTAIQRNYFLENQNKVLPPGFKISDEWIINKDDILITRAGPKNRVGIVCYVDKITRKLILSDKTIRLRVSESLIYHKYISLALNSPLCRPIIESKMTGMAESQVNISQNNMGYFCLPLPPLAEQIRICEKSDQLMSLCDELEKRIEKLKKYSEKILDTVLREAFKA